MNPRVVTLTRNEDAAHPADEVIRALVEELHDIGFGCAAGRLRHTDTLAAHVGVEPSADDAVPVISRLFGPSAAGWPVLHQYAGG
jgi:hypothetical protein